MFVGLALRVVVGLALRVVVGEYDNVGDIVKLGVGVFVEELVGVGVKQYI